MNHPIDRWFTYKKRCPVPEHLFYTFYAYDSFLSLKDIASTRLYQSRGIVKRIYLKPAPLFPFPHFLRNSACAGIPPFRKILRVVSM